MSVFSCAMHRPLHTRIFVLQMMLEFLSFVSCPVDIDAYLDASRSSASVSWTEPLLPSVHSEVVVMSSIGSWQPVFTFSLGTHVITYATQELDLGGTLKCEFKVRVQYGFAIQSNSIGHLNTDPYAMDFLVDDDGLTGGGAPVPVFVGDVLLNGLSIGIRSPPNKPFSLFLRTGFLAQIVVELNWCETGAFPVDLAGFVSDQAAVRSCMCACVRARCVSATGY